MIKISKLSLEKFPKKIFQIIGQTVTVSEVFDQNGDRESKSFRNSKIVKYDKN